MPMWLPRLVVVALLSCSYATPTDPALKALQWAAEANVSAMNAGENAQKVKEMAAKSSGSLSSAIASMGAAKEAMDRALILETNVKSLKDRLWQTAKASAEAQVSQSLQEIRAKVKKQAEQKARQQAGFFRKQMKAKGKIESAKASQAYKDLINSAGRSAAHFSSVGDALLSQSNNLHMNAASLQGVANQYLASGDMSNAQKNMQQSQNEIDVASNLRGQAIGVYDKATAIAANIPVYASQAVAAANHAQALYDLDVVAIPQSLV